MRDKAIGKYHKKKLIHENVILIFKFKKIARKNT